VLPTKPVTGSGLIRASGRIAPGRNETRLPHPRPSQREDGPRCTFEFAEPAIRQCPQAYSNCGLRRSRSQRRGGLGDIFDSQIEMELECYSSSMTCTFVYSSVGILK